MKTHQSTIRLPLLGSKLLPQKMQKWHKPVMPCRANSKDEVGESSRYKKGWAVT